VSRGARLVNLSLGTKRPEHRPALEAAVERASAADTIVVAAAEQDGIRWLPGSLPAVVSVELDWSCPRDAYRVDRGPDGRIVFRASGFPRDIPGVSREDNLKGLSFAVANVTGFAARLLLAEPSLSREELECRLVQGARAFDAGDGS
jgi:hypothetical protein